MLAEIIARVATDNLYRFVVTAPAGSSELVPLTSGASEDVSAVALRTIRGWEAAPTETPPPPCLV